MEVWKIKTKTDSKETKDKIIDLFYEKHLRPSDIAKQLKVAKSSITKVIQKDSRYIEEKESRKAKNKEKNKIQKRVCAKNRREKETSTSGTGSNSWFKDNSSFPALHGPFIMRGGNLWTGENSGLFNFTRDGGGSSYYGGFRSVLVKE